MAEGILQRQEMVFANAFVDRVVGMKNEGDVRQAYEMFDRGLTGKILFDPWK